MNAAILLTALLSLFQVPADKLSCILRNRARIVRDVTLASEARGVPIEALLAVGFLESHLGCARGSGGCWGAPSSPLHRLRAGTVHHAAAALAWGYRRCGGSTFGAVSHFRYGLCHPPRRSVGYGPTTALNLIERMVARAAQMQTNEGDRRE